MLLAELDGQAWVLIISAIFLGLFKLAELTFNYKAQQAKIGRLDDAAVKVEQVRVEAVKAAVKVEEVKVTTEEMVASADAKLDAIISIITETRDMVRKVK